MRADEHSAEPPPSQINVLWTPRLSSSGMCHPLSGLREVLYTLEWTLGEVTFTAVARHGLSLMTGALRWWWRRWLVSASVQLVPCEGEAEQWDLSDLRHLDALVHHTEARAEHFGGLEDILTVLTPIAEPLLGPSQLDIGPIAVVGLRYCAMHYLVNKAPVARNLPGVQRYRASHA